MPALRIYRPAERATECTPRQPKELPDFLRANDVAKLLRVCVEEIERCQQPTRRHGRKNQARAVSKLYAAKQDLLIVQLGILMGLRNSEFCKLDVEHIDLENREILIKRGKGGKDRLLPIPGRLLEPLREWIGQRLAGPVFVTPNGRITDKTVWYRVHRLGVLAGLMAGKLRPHALRHTFATRVWKAKRDLLGVQRLLGHKSPQTTVIYTHCDVSDLRDAVDAGADL